MRSFAFALPLLAFTSACTEYDLTAKEDDNQTSGPQILVEPQRLVWDPVAFGETAIKSFTITSVGTDDLEVEGTLLNGPGTFLVNNAVFPAMLAPEETLTVDVAYTPDTATEDSAIVDVLSNDGSDPEVPVELLATAGSPELQVTPDNWDFGELPVACNTALTVTMTNVGTATLEVSDILQSGTGFEWADSPDLPINLVPGESDEVEIIWRPITLGNYMGDLTFVSNDPAGDRVALQTGTAIDEADCLPVNEGGSGEYELSFTAEYEYADVTFLLDTSGSMTNLATSMASEFSTIANDLTSVISDITFGVATYEDYYYSNFGDYGDLPFRLRQQQTDDLGSVQSVLNSIPINYGYDTPESTLEALRQVATGYGYDQNCNGRYDSLTDVPPFVAGASDAYSGSATGIYNAGVSGTGSLGGMGFREGTLPIIIYATDAPFRDPTSSDWTRSGAPRGCTDATMANTIAALNAMNARTIGVGVQYFGSSYFDAVQLNDIAVGTGSYGDMDGNGSVEAAVVTWSGASSTFRSTIVTAVEGLIEGATFDEIRLDIYGDDLGIVQSVTPEAYYNVASGDPTDFTVEIEGEAVDGPADDVIVLELVLTGVLPTGGELILQRSNLYVVVGG